VVVGGGPAGLSAATWAARYRRSVLVVDSGEYRNRWAVKAHGYLGSDPSNPMALLARARADLANYPEVELCAGRATAARREADGRFVVTVDGEEHAGLRLILAMGVVDTFPEVAGFFDHYGRSVFHCATCDGYEAQGRSVVILGWGEQVVAFAVGLLDWADRLTVVTEGHTLEGDDRHRRLLARHDIGLVEDDAVEFVGEPGALRGVRLAGGHVLDADLVFFSIAHRPAWSWPTNWAVTPTSPTACASTATAERRSTAATPPATSPPASSSSRWLSVRAPPPAWPRRSRCKARAGRQRRRRRRPTPGPSWTTSSSFSVRKRYVFGALVSPERGRGGYPTARSAKALEEVRRRRRARARRSTWRTPSALRPHIRPTSTRVRGWPRSKP